ncbi:hypothetical protein [Gracilimonas sp.]|uniref:hypothetical protein n=1 Tax=Gracilimonas sp. TaxID=1974203 RepID=UPI0032EBDAA3
MLNLKDTFDGTRMRRIEIIFADVEFSYPGIIRYIRFTCVPSTKHDYHKQKNPDGKARRD